MEKNTTPISNLSSKLTKLTDFITQKPMKTGVADTPQLIPAACHDMEIVVCLIVTPKKRWMFLFYVVLQTYFV